jgi:hypothetical protein
MQNNIRVLINEYIDAAKGYGEGISNGNSKLSDQYFDKIEKLFQEINSLESSGLDEIAKLLQHENESVRLWASSHLLNYPKYASFMILEKIKNSGTILGLTAEVTLDQWRNGKIPY